MTYQQKLGAIRRACVEANPEIVEIKSSGRPGIVDGRAVLRPIRLADVMLSIGRREDRIHVTCDGWFCVLQVPTMQFARRAQWDLRNDDLSKQSDETVDFIHGLLKGV